MIEIREVSVRNGKYTLPTISMVIPDGCYAVLMGPTGSGKTTLLEAICGLRAIDHGSVLMGGVDVSHWSPSDRQLGYVPQDLALFPTLSVHQHLAFALRLRGMTSMAIDARVEELADLLQISHLLSRFPKQLSGGEAQRVAMGRAISFGPRVLLLDEPLSALDESTRSQMQSLLRDVHKALKMTTLHVTHSETEAAALADQRFVMPSIKS